MTQEERKNRIIARGEFSDHCHAIVGNCTIEREGEDVFINVEDSNAVLRHLLESKYMEGQEVWTQEHHDVPLTGDVVRQGDVILEPVGTNRYKYVAQTEYDPFEKILRKVMD